VLRCRKERDGPTAVIGEANCSIASEHRLGYVEAKRLMKLRREQSRYWRPNADSWRIIARSLPPSAVTISFERKRASGARAFLFAPKEHGCAPVVLLGVVAALLPSLVALAILVWRDRIRRRDADDEDPHQ